MTPEQVAERARAIADGVVAWDMVDWTGWSPIEVRACAEVALLLVRQRNYVAARPARLRALRLFRSWLTPAELEEYRRRRHVTLTGSAGGRYRLLPVTGSAQRVERHGSREYCRATYCLHPVEPVPPADISLGHYLLLKTDEPAFLEEANASERRLWDGDWLRQLNARRRERKKREENQAPASQ